MLVIAAPGQGAQTPGYLAPWLELPQARETVERASQAARIDLALLGTSGNAETIRDTAVAQPLLVASGIASAQALLAGLPQPDMVAGHSVGEITVAALAGVLTPHEALSFVATRAHGMAAAATQTATSMTAIVGGEREAVLDAIAMCGLTAANHNGSGQIVAAGTVNQLAQLAKNPPRRARLFPLSVAGAFHTDHMRSAVDQLAAFASTLHPCTPRFPILSNADGTIVDSGADVLKRLVAQVSLPVRWDLCMDTMAAHGVTGIIELSPAGTLTGIAKRNLPNVELCTLNTPEDLDDARAFVRCHAGATA